MENLVVLVVSATGFQPVEYQETRRALEDAGFRVMTASDHRGATGSAVATDGSGAHIDLLLEDMFPQSTRAVVLIGGSGALDHLDTVATHHKLQALFGAGIVIGAICVATRILAHAGLLTGRKATGWDGDNKLTELYQSQGVLACLTQEVVIDAPFVTGQGPAAAYAFGSAVAQVLRQG